MQALEETLLELAVEDMQQHGRLPAIKQLLTELINSKDTLDQKFLCLFQLKDFIGNNKEKESELIANIEAKNMIFTQEEIN